MHSSTISLSFPPNCSVFKRSHKNQLEQYSFTPLNLQFCGLRKDAAVKFSFSQLKRCEIQKSVRILGKNNVIAASVADNGSAPTSFDYDVVIIGAGVGGHGAALHAVEKV